MRLLRLTIASLLLGAALLSTGCDETLDQYQNEPLDSAGPCDFNGDGFVSNSEQNSEECLRIQTGG